MAVGPCISAVGNGKAAKPSNVVGAHLVLYLIRVAGAEVERDEGEPDDAGGVHGEPDKLRLVEVLGHLPGLDGVDRADSDEDHAVDLASYQK